MRASTLVVTGAVAAAAVMALASPAEAQVVIKQPNAHPDYSVELEPHGTFVFFHRYYGYGRGYGGYRGNSFYAFSDPEAGVGFRATIPIVDPGFIPKLNNTITFGIDVTNCQFCGRGYGFSIYTPVGIQWNFFITRKFSAFADLGFILATEGFYHSVYGDFMGMLGGRYHFSDDVAFTFRIGYPFINVGVSFFAG
jgi:hypothetical protein